VSARGTALGASLARNKRYAADTTSGLKEPATLVLSQANAVLQAFRHTVVAWLWLWLALIAVRMLPHASSADEVAFYRVHACRWF
jgi:hypothetical protein